SNEKDKKATLTPQEQKSELAKLREIFASVDKLLAKGARWVEVQAGAAKHKAWHHGWLLRETDDEIEILSTDGWKAMFDKKKLRTKKPDAEFEYSDVWEVRDGDFEKFCHAFLTKKKEERKEDPNELGVYRMLGERMELEGAVVNAARLACWADVMGKDEV